MSPERWKEIERLYQSAVELPPDQRPQFLTESCSDDELRREVESLLAQRNAPSFMEGRGLDVARDLLSRTSKGNLVGCTIGPYEIRAFIATGGMGDVYRARDFRLNRDVAVKVLPPQFSEDVEQVRRSEREAKLLASLNHPNIAAIYDLQESGGSRCLILEFVEGQTLAERLKRGRVPLGEALEISRQIAEALEAAHEQGIVHRDLKPGNIMIVANGAVKILDFGIAKMLEPQTEMIGPTHIDGASVGVVLGTPSYMSPEQARGNPIDKRTDIWSFGCVLYELLTGRQAFQGGSVTDTLAAVLTADPDWNRLPAGTPWLVQRLLHRALKKDSRQRLGGIREARIEIEEAGSAEKSAASSHAAPTAPARSSRAAWVAAGAAALVAAGFAIPGIRYLRETPLPMPVVRFNTELGADAWLANKFVDLKGFSVGSAVLLSPNGRVLVFAGTKTPVDGSKTQLFVRPLDQLKALPLAGTQGARNAFFSPDGQWIAFFADRKLKKISVTGGSPVTLCDAPDDRGGTWSDDDSIIFAPNGSSGLMRVPSGGGTPESLTKLVPPEVTHRWPNVVRGGRAVLFAADDSGTGFEDANIIVQSLQTGQRKVVKRGGYQPHYLTSGHLLYIHDGTLFAAPFNMDRMELSAPPAAVLEGVMSSPGSGGSQFAVSETGALAYLPGSNGPQSSSMVWVDRKGTPQPVPAPAGVYANPRLSPDGRRIALSVSDGGMEDIWTYDLMRDTLMRLSPDGAGNGYPVWTPDGKRVVYRSSRGGQPNLYWTAADGTGTYERLTTSENMQTPLSVSPDGHTLVYAEQNPKILFDLMALPLEGDRKPQMTRQTQFNNRIAQFSPDGKWLAYVSDESKQYEVYVQPFPGPGGPQRVSTEGGVEIFWAKNGELFYRTGTNQEKMMAVDIQTQPALLIGKPRQLFEGPYVSNAQAGSLSPNYAVSADGQWFLMFKSSEQAQSAPSRVTVVLNWLEELKLKVPVHP